MESSQDKSTEVKINPEAVVLMDVSIRGMSCTDCENTVKSSISELPGVIDVSASFVDGKALVKVDTTLTGADKISQAVNGKGYKVTGYSLAEKAPVSQ